MIKNQLKTQQNLENIYVRGIEFLALRVVLLQPSVVVDRDLIFNFVEIFQCSILKLLYETKININCERSKRKNDDETNQKRRKN